jgi:4-hydroxyproline epimerase
VPSFLAARDLEVDSPLGTLRFDVGYGGNFYAIIDPQSNFRDMSDHTASELVRLSQILRPAINTKYPDRFVHPEDSNIRDVSHILWTGAPLSGNATARNAVFYGDKAIDRSPCGTGTSARMAQWVARNRLSIGDTFVHESYIGSHFEGRVLGSARVGETEGIIPQIRGSAWVYGYNTLIIDQDHPYPEGFQVV